MLHKENCVGRTRSRGKKNVGESVQEWKVREDMSEEGQDEEESQESVCVGDRVEGKDEGDGADQEQ